MNLEDMSKDERSLLIYVESVSVDYGGLVDSRKINAADRVILKRWHDTQFVFFSRITWNSVQMLHDHNNTDLVRLSDEAWKLASEERKARYVRISSKRPICDLETVYD
jgi:hypothetical protein